MQRFDSAAPSLAENKDVGVVSSRYELHPGNSPASVQQEVQVCIQSVHCFGAQFTNDPTVIHSSVIRRTKVNLQGSREPDEKARCAEPTEGTVATKQLSSDDNPPPLVQLEGKGPWKKDSSKLRSTLMHVPTDSVKKNELGYGQN
jgi:hypothetical protein